jgi:hypothetical protein
MERCSACSKCGGKSLPADCALHVEAAADSVVLCSVLFCRFGRHLGEAVPLMVQYGQDAAEGDDELREYALQVGCLNQRFRIRLLYFHNVCLVPLLPVAPVFITVSSRCGALCLGSRITRGCCCWWLYQTTTHLLHVAGSGQFLVSLAC